MDNRNLTQSRILALTVVRNPRGQLENPLVRKEVFEFWRLCKTPMTQNCNGLLASQPDLSRHSDLFMIKDTKHDRVLFAFRIFSEKNLDDMPANTFDQKTTDALRHGYHMVDYVKFHPSTENNNSLRNVLFEIFLGSVYLYSVDQNIKKLVTSATHSTFANKLLLRAGFDSKPGDSILYLDEFLPEARHLAQNHQSIWKARKALDP